jgi:hypothetical protein
LLVKKMTKRPKDKALEKALIQLRNLIQMLRARRESAPKKSAEGKKDDTHGAVVFVLMGAGGFHLTGAGAKMYEDCLMHSLHWKRVTRTAEPGARAPPRS